MIQFIRPIYLLLLIPALYYAYRLSSESLADMSRLKSRLALGLRAVILISLIFALAGPRMVRHTSQQCVVFLMDVSDSISKSSQEKALAFMNEALGTMKPSQKVGVIAFGGDASVEFAPCNLKKVDKIYSIPNTSNTDISQPIGLAMALFPEKCAKKIVLVSDGHETIGKAIEQAMLAGSNDVSLDVVPITDEIRHETLLDKMVCPRSVKVGEPFDLKVVAVSTDPTTADIRILRNGEPVGVRRVDLTRGKSILTFQQSVDKSGSYEYKAILESGLDTRAENNIALSRTIVRGKPKVLYVEGESGQSQYLAGALRSGGMDVEVRNRSGVPNSLAQMSAYDMIVLSDVPAWNLTPEQMKMLKSGVRDLGIGLTMVGGENSFGAGGYFDTPVEEALPVDMSIRKTKVMPSLSVVVVMDKSGSMSAVEGGVEKIRMANDAASSVVKLLQPIDYVGVVVCHSDPSAAVPLTPASNKDPIYRQIATIRAEGGGIAVFPSIKMAYRMISASNTRQKHVILLADGADCDEQQGVFELVQRMAREKITVTAVAIGDGPHVPFLKGVAYYGKGGFYLTKYARDLRAIFTKDVLTVSKSLIIEEPFTPGVDAGSPELSGVAEAGVPPLLGYVATSPKPAARVSMTSHKNDPILATWQYGIGKSTAFTSDCKAHWAARWVSWPSYNKFWAQVLRSTMRKSPATDFQTSVDISSGMGRVTIDAVDDKGNFLNMIKFKGSVVNPGTKTEPLTIEQTGPGRYEAAFDAREMGSYVVNVGRADQGENAPEVSIVNIPYSPEYKDIGPDLPMLRRLASETGGRFAPDASDVFRKDFRPVRAYIDLWRFFALIAIFLLPVDVAVRRLNVSAQEVAEAYQQALDYLRGLPTFRRKAAPESHATVSALLQSKKDRVRPSVPTVEIKLPDMPVEAPPVREKTGEQASDADTTHRLLDAKKRARDKMNSGE